jgi:hypothetical protein
MDGEEQSQQLHGAPRATGPGSSEPPHAAPMTADTGDTGNEADQSSGTAVTSPGQRRGRFHLPKPKIGLLAIVITALVGFFFGVASNQVSDFVKRSNDCIEGVEQYIVGVSVNFVPATHAEHDPGFSDEQKAAAATKYIDSVDASYYKVRATCPLSGHMEYLDKNTIKDFSSNFEKMDACVEIPGCDDDWDSVAVAALSSAQALLREAQEVPNWGLVRRAKYVFSHWY